MTRARWFALVLAVAVVTVVWALLPARSGRLTLAPDPLVARGAIHVHTVRSDGAGTPERVAGAAHRAGLDFVVLTDHGDATRTPDPPRYVEGVLLIDAVEISTEDGHLLALGMGKAPYRLAGEARDVIDDVHRLGGFAIAAHPDSPKEDLQWRDWKAAIDGLEWINADSEWRDESRLTLSRALLTYPIRPGETMASLLDRPVRTLERWDSLAASRPIVTIAGQDVHARVPLSAHSDVGEGPSLGLPSYEAAFRTLSQSVVLSTPLGHTADAAARDATSILTALRGGASFTVVDGIAGPAALDFHAVVDGETIGMGRSFMNRQSMQFVAAVRPDVSDAVTVLLRNGREVASAPNGHPIVVPRSDDAPAAYRVEVRLPRAPGTPPVPWIVSNPIYAGRPKDMVWLTQPTYSEAEKALFDGTLAAWTIEHATTSEGRVEVTSEGGRPRLHFTWRLAGGPPSGQYAALALPVQGSIVKDFTNLSIRASAPRPVRLSVQVRIPQAGGLRWKRSIHVGEPAPDNVINLGDMKPIEAPAGTRLDLSRIDTLLFVVDTVNATPGSAGELWIEDVRWRR